jgi:hypothetical protein
VSTDSKELDTRPDARANPPAGGIAAAAQPVTDPNRPGEPAVVQQPFATNHPLTEKDRKRAMKKAQEAAKKKQKGSCQASGKPAACYDRPARYRAAARRRTAAGGSHHTANAAAG